MHQNSAHKPDPETEATTTDRPGQSPACDLSPTIAHPNARPPQQHDTLAFVPSVASSSSAVSGTVLGGYEVLTEIARGGMGIVFKGVWRNAASAATPRPVSWRRTWAASSTVIPPRPGLSARPGEPFGGCDAIRPSRA